MTTNMKLATMLTTLVIAASALPSVARAENTSGFGRITFLTSGWSANIVRVETSAPFNNPEFCPTANGYITDPADPGTPLYHSILLQALVSGKQVSIITRGCFLSWPKIVGVTVLP